MSRRNITDRPPLKKKHRRAFFRPPHCPAPDGNGNDFGFNPEIFSDPAAQFKHIHEDLHFKFGGIRKPRVFSDSHRRLANTSGWLLPLSTGKDNLNYTNAGLRAWYARGNAHFVADNLTDFWWNDEGETQFFTYAPRAVQFHPHGGQSDFVWLSARTPHGAYVW